MNLRPLKQLEFDNNFHRLGDDFYTEVTPQGILKPFLVGASPPVAEMIGLDPSALKTTDFIDLFSGNTLLPGFQPLAMVYSGHQFGYYNPQLGDGRALLLGEVVNDTGKWDLVLKGAGPTPYSRRGDGRSVLRSAIREFLGSEALAGLGIPTTRALCVIGGEDSIYRERVEKSATLVRIAESHVRFGSFEYFHHNEKEEAVKQLADYVIAHHFPDVEISGKKSIDKYQRFFASVIQKTAKMIARWQAVGFAHGVMNTDNMSILGQTFDYGPFGFMEDYDPGYICNHSDHQGRYAFDQQPKIGLSNLNALGYALMFLIPRESLMEALQAYEPTFDECYTGLMRKKLGLSGAHEKDPSLWKDLLGLMERHAVDYTILFRTLSEYSIDGEKTGLCGFFNHQEDFAHWLARYNHRLKQQDEVDEVRQKRMKRVNPKYILRNYLAQVAIEKAENERDFSEIDRLRNLLDRPFDEHSEMEAYANESPEWGKLLKISCSS
ncbi:MAG: YdiU family protein [Nitrospiria bacterium]